MPTDKNKISAYLDDQDFRLLDDIASSHRISKSQAVILAIRSLAGTLPPPQVTSSPAMERIELLESQFKALVPTVESLELLLKDVASRVESLELTQPKQTTVESVELAVSDADAEPVNYFPDVEDEPPLVTEQAPEPKKAVEGQLGEPTEGNPLGLIPGELYPTQQLAALFEVRTQTIANWFGEPPKTPPSTEMGLKYQGKLSKVSEKRSKPVLYRYQP